eukprot:COSAG02_NODE_40131_length_409_cov_0.567742_1_plen_73_part_10
MDQPALAPRLRRTDWQSGVVGLLFFQRGGGWERGRAVAMSGMALLGWRAQPPTPYAHLLPVPSGSNLRKRQVC